MGLKFTLGLLIGLLTASSKLYHGKLRGLS